MNAPAGPAAPRRSAADGRASASGGTAADGRASLPHRVAAFVRRHDRVALLVAGFVLAVGAAALYDALAGDTAPLSQDQVNDTVATALEEYDALPPVSTRAYGAVGASVVRVQRLSGEDELVTEEGVGTGVMITADGQILTNLHVVQGAERLGIVFADGFETEATVAGAQPENDLAVLQAEVIPEGVPPATMGSAANLRPGDEVIAVGNPFGIGPSVSAGVVSGLGRSYYARGRDAVIDNLIQFDAAANPGNSGGPLVNRRGEVVGIVTSILNPTDDGVFIGIGFAVPIESAAAAIGPNPF